MKKPERLNYDWEHLCSILMRVTEIKKFFKGHLTSWITELYIMVNGRKTVIEMVKELRFGKMAVNLLVIGEMTKPMEKED